MLDAILNDGLSYISVKDLEGRFVYANDLDASLYGVKPEEMIGKTAESWVGREQFLQWLETDQAAIESGRKLHYDVYSRTGTNGVDHWFDTVKSPIRVGDRTLLLVVHRDVTAIKRAEEERDLLRAKMMDSQKMEVISLLAGSVAHDFNNLLTIIMASSRLLAQGETQEKETGFLVDSITRSSERASELVARLLVLARKDAGSRAPLDLHDYLRETRPLIESALSEKITVAFEFASGPAWIEGNASLIQQALINLVLNARDAMPKEGRIVFSTSFAAAPAEGGDRRVTLEVRDTGTGMDPETRRRALDLFFTTKPTGQGSGLGLVVAQRIMEQHGGEIRLESAPGAGTSLFLDFPRAAAPEAKVPLPVLQSRLRGKTVLVAEDEDLLRTLIARSLSGAGMQVITACSADEAWERFQEVEGKIDVLVTDVVMPGRLDGFSLRRRLHEIRGDLPALLMSGYSFDYLPDAEELPPNTEFLAKPFAIPALQQKILGLLGL